MKAAFRIRDVFGGSGIVDNNILRSQKTEKKKTGGNIRIVIAMEFHSEFRCVQQRNRVA